MIKSSGFLTHPDKYLAFLNGTWRARRTLERDLDKHQAQRLFDAWPTRRIASLVRQDYRDITGLDLEEPEPSPVAARSPSNAEILGILYVLEGSSLGARLIARSALRMGFGPTRGARHLARQTGWNDAWSSFLIELENHPMSDEDEARCKLAALCTFETFERAYREVSISG